MKGFALVCADHNAGARGKQTYWTPDETCQILKLKGRANVNF
jgi:hypothetical protein